MNIRDGKSEHHEHLAFGGENSAMSNARERSAQSEATPGTSGALFPHSRVSGARVSSRSALSLTRAPFQLASTRIENLTQSNDAISASARSSA